MESKQTFLASYPLWIMAWAVAYLHSRLYQSPTSKISFQRHAFFFTQTFLIGAGGKIKSAYEKDFILHIFLISNNVFVCARK